MASARRRGEGPGLGQWTVLSTAIVVILALAVVLRDHQLFYVDSRTTVATVAFDTAREEGVHCAFRNVPFLDDVAEVAAVLRERCQQRT